MLLFFMSTNKMFFFLPHPSIRSPTNPSTHLPIRQTPWLLFHCTQSSNLTPDPPKQSKALPIVRSTLPRLSVLTVSKSSKCRPPPAYVTGIEHHSARRSTNCSSIPLCSPSLSAAWIKNSEQYGSSDCIDSVDLI
jgi:hypothetical protein